MKAISFIKNNAMAMVAGAAIVVFSSFKLAEKIIFPADEVWFEFNSSLNPGDSGYETAITTPSNYTNTGSATNPSQCSSTPKVCAVKAEPDGSGHVSVSTLNSLKADMLNPSSSNPAISKKPND
ncbi:MULTISPECIES: hypothetical protein [Sphingobacterium]|uniref:hypothetical protein n=1 Tax=Sphingobacterium TaxID=28453 RepID=UPI00257C5688|nr:MULTISPECIES: hypothetical protein [Sphingobacterium]